MRPHSVAPVNDLFMEYIKEILTFRNKECSISSNHIIIPITILLIAISLITILLITN